MTDKAPLFEAYLGELLKLFHRLCLNFNIESVIQQNQMTNLILGKA
jgi:hypothetical protein